jgi:MYXO-CTERM domain-containing protein
MPADRCARLEHIGITALAEKLLWFPSHMTRSLGIAVFSTLLLGGLASSAVAAGTLTVTYTTQSHGGPYAPAHVVAVWVEDSGGGFVKTIDRWAGVRKQHLVAWTQKAGTADADAVSGATLISHTQPLTKTWDLTNRQGAEIPDGTYTIRMELADSNATQPLQNAQGTFTFTKSPAGFNQTGLSNGGFTNVSIVYTPGGSNPPPPPPASGPDAGVDENPGERPDVITGGCSTSGGGADASGVLVLALVGASVLASRRRTTRTSP